MIDIISSFTLNIASVIILSFLNAFIVRKLPQFKSDKLVDIIHGLSFGVMIVLAMMSPIKLAEGVTTDSRIALISLGSLYGGPISVIIMIAFASLFRLNYGGIGVWAGITAIMLAGITSNLIARKWKYGLNIGLNAKRNIIWGVILALQGISTALLLPIAFEDRLAIISLAIIPLLIFYPLGLTLFGMIYDFANIEFRYLLQKEDLHKSNELLSLQESKLISLSLFSGGIAHDFNNSLQLVRAGIDLLSVKNKGNKLIEDISKALDQATYMTNQLLTYSGELKPNIQNVNIDDFIEEHDGVYDLTFGKPIKIEYSLNSQNKIIQIDKGNLNQVIINLLKNAKEATSSRKEKKVMIKTSLISINKQPNEPGILSRGSIDLGEYLEICISDNGIGIPHNNINQIFDPYFSTTSKGKGLGLAVVLGIVFKYKGFISVNSAIDVDTNISMYFPIRNNKSSKKDILLKP